MQEIEPPTSHVSNKKQPVLCIGCMADAKQNKSGHNGAETCRSKSHASTTSGMLDSVGKGWDTASPFMNSIQLSILGQIMVGFIPRLGC